MVNKLQVYSNFDIESTQTILYPNQIFDVDDHEYFDEYNEELTRASFRSRNPVWSNVYEMIYIMTGPKCPIIPFLGTNSSVIYHPFLSSFIVHTMYIIEIEKLYACYRFQSFGSYLTNSFAMEKDNF